MMFLIVLALAQASLGSPIDTPEVASAKAAHLLAHSLASSRAESSPPAIASAPVQYQTIAAPPALTPSGHLADAPEVAAAKAAHFAGRPQLGDHSWESHIYNPYPAPPAIRAAAGYSYLAPPAMRAAASYPYLAPPTMRAAVSHLGATPEAAIANAAHIAAHAKASRLQAAAISYPGLAPTSPDHARSVPAFTSGVDPYPSVLYVAKSAQLADLARASAVENVLVNQYPSSYVLAAPFGYIANTPEFPAAKSYHLAAKWGAN